MAKVIAMTLEEKREALRCLMKVAQYARKAIEETARGQVLHDIREYKGHDESMLDRDAQGIILSQLHRHFPQFRGTVTFEDDRYEHVGEVDGEGSERFLTIDEIDGTTNLKRRLASSFTYPISASISMAFGTSDRLGDVAVSVVHALDTGENFGAIRAEDGHFLAFVDGKLLFPSDVIPIRGDSNERVLIPGYSFRLRDYKAAVEEAFIRGGLKRVYEGSRSSSMDAIGILRGLNDAYVDVRALFGDEGKYGAMLQGYDVAGVIPIALGAGLCVEAIDGRPWQEHRNTERLALAIARPDVMPKVLAALANAPTPEAFLRSREHTPNGPRVSETSP